MKAKTNERAKCEKPMNMNPIISCVLVWLC